MAKILDTIKDGLGIPIDVTNFDGTLVGEINSSLFILYQMGVGTSAPYSITPSSEWSIIVETSVTEPVKMYILASVRLAFDPPQNAFLVDVIKKRLEELTWRITTQLDPTPEEAPEDEDA